MYVSMTLLSDISTHPKHKEWTRLSSQHLTVPSAGPSFFGRIFHPAFNVDVDEAEDVATSFQNYVRAVGKGVQGLRNIYGKVRESRIGEHGSNSFIVWNSCATYIELSRAERLLSYSLLSLITSKPLSSVPEDIQEEDGAVGEKGDNQRKGTINKEGAWCWREGCTGKDFQLPIFPELTKHRMSETFKSCTEDL
jgi:sorting nexin-9/18/33